MVTARSKVNVGVTLLTLFLVTLVTGIMLHLKKHGIIIEPRPLIKVIHWVAGFLMTGFACWHASQFWKMFGNMKKQFHFFWYDTCMVILMTAATFATGLVKLLSPVKIPNLGLWHYFLGIAMAIVICFHLVRGIPSLRRLIKASHHVQQH